MRIAQLPNGKWARFYYPDTTSAQDLRAAFVNNAEINNGRFASYAANVIRFLRDERGDGVQHPTQR